MKKAISILLSIIMMLSLTAVAFCAEDVTPVIIVSGMGSTLYLDNADGSTETVFPPQADTIIKAVATLVPGLAKSVVTKDYSGLDAYLTPVKDMFYDISCDTNGKLNSNVYTDFSDNNMVGRELSYEMSEFDIAQDFAEATGAENTYFFNYIWSLSPLEIAQSLDRVIDKVLSETASNKVNIVACSMGGTVMMSYLAMFGNEKINNLVLTSTAFQGTDIAGQLFNEKIDINIIDLLRYFSDYTGYDFVQPVFAGLEKGMKLDGGKAVESIDGILDNFVKNAEASVFGSVFMDTFVSMPGMWALLPYDDYYSAKETLFKDKEEYAFLKDIDWYMENAQSKAQELIFNAEATDTNVYIVATYLTSGIPLTPKSSNTTDNLIDLKFASGGATVASFSEQAEAVTGKNCLNPDHNHISADKMIDASTCMLPEQTWFVKNVSHMGYDKGTDLTKLLIYIATSEEKIDIYSNELYPQFMQYNKTTGKLAPVKDDDRVTFLSSWFEILQSFATKLFGFLKSLASTVSI